MLLVLGRSLELLQTPTYAPDPGLSCMLGTWGGRILEVTVLDCDHEQLYGGRTTCIFLHISQRQSGTNLINTSFPLSALKTILFNYLIIGLMHISTCTGRNYKGVDCSLFQQRKVQPKPMAGKKRQTNSMKNKPDSSKIAGDKHWEKNVL